jgi:hypothetical protein
VDRFLSKERMERGKWLNIRQTESEDTSVAKSYKATWPFWVFVCCSLWLSLFVKLNTLQLADVLQAFPFPESHRPCTHPLCVFTYFHGFTHNAAFTEFVPGSAPPPRGAPQEEKICNPQIQSSPWGYATVANIPPLLFASPSC